MDIQAFSKFLSILMTRRKRLSLALMVPSLIEGCLLGYAMPQPLSNVA